MFEFAQHTLVALACVIVPASLLMWLLSLDGLFKGRPLLELVPRRAVPWSLVDLLLVGFVGFAVLSISQWFCLQQFDLPEGSWDLQDLTPGQQVHVLITFSASSLLTWLVALGVCRWRSGARASDLGWAAATWPRDLGLGCAAFVMLIVPVLCIHFVAQKLLPTEETHPFIDLILEDPRIEYLLPIALAALVAAPLVEEFFFRVLLQGWLEQLLARLESPARRVPAAEDQGEASGSAAAPPPAAGHDIPTGVGGPVDVVTELPAHSQAANPYRSPGPDGADAGRGDAACAATAPVPLPGLPRRQATRRLAIGLSSMAFAMAHFGQGPAPISLFFLALGLGYMYQRTHRVLPCIVVHFLVNLTAVAQMALAILERPA